MNQSDKSSLPGEATINIGLDVSDGRKIAREEALAAVLETGAKALSVRVERSETEDTLIVRLDRALTPDEAFKLSEDLHQEAIAIKYADGSGELFGPMAEKWRPFNNAYFIDSGDLK